MAVIDPGPLQGRISLLMDELALGMQWERPCILIAIHRSETVRSAVQTLLEHSVEGRGHACWAYSVDKAHYDIPLDLLGHPQRARAVFFVHGLRWGGGRGYSNAYRALNMHREYLVDGRLRAVFWLTGGEVRQLVRFAPDFWAFRHQVVEFLDLPAGVQEIPAGADRVEQVDQLTALGCYEEALNCLRWRRRAHPQDARLALKTAEVYLEMERLHLAWRWLRIAGRLQGDDPALQMTHHHLAERTRQARPAVGGFSCLPTLRPRDMIG